MKEIFLFKFCFFLVIVAFSLQLIKVKNVFKSWYCDLTSKLFPEVCVWLPYDLPVLPGAAGRADGHQRLLRAALGVDVGGALLRVGGARQHDVRHARAHVAVVAWTTAGLT